MNLQTFDRWYMAVVRRLHLVIPAAAFFPLLCQVIEQGVNGETAAAMEEKLLPAFFLQLFLILPAGFLYLAEKKLRSLGLYLLCVIACVSASWLCSGWLLGRVLGIPYAGAGAVLSVIFMVLFALDALQMRFNDNERVRAKKLQDLSWTGDDYLLPRPWLQILVIFLPDCHESLAGIIAGRIRERFSRPVFVLTRTEEGLVKGSGRSIEAYDMFASMTAVKECFTKFGGHKMAAGLSMKEEDIPLLRERALWTLDMTEELNLLDPCGMANPKPVFAARGIRLHSLRIMGRGQNVLRMEAEDARGARLTLIWFCEADRFQEMVREAAGSGAWDALYAGRADLSASIVYYPDINEWRGRKSLQFVIKDMKIQPR